MDLNADLGEGFGIWRLGDDAALLSVITSANVACGFHAGDAQTMRRVCDLATAAGVVVGAQVGYRDLAGFGRRNIDYDKTELRDEIVYQIGALDAFCRRTGVGVGYVKPHGALYNRAAVDAETADAIIAAVTDYDRYLPVVCLPAGILATRAEEAGLRVVAEGFADRSYTGDGTLVPRGQPGAVIFDHDTVAAQAVRLATAGEVLAGDGTVVSHPVQTLCLHGDTPGAVSLAIRVREALSAAGVPLAPFVAA